MKILVACEYSGIVRDAFLSKGHDAISCDLEPTDNNGPHIQNDVTHLLDKPWDLIIAHPPCTYIAQSGVQYLYKENNRFEKMKTACIFFKKCLTANSPKIAIENPVPHRYASAIIGPYTQLIRPNMFGETSTKGICLWLKGLPPLISTLTVTNTKSRDEFYKLTGWDKNKYELRRKIRSRFFPNVAKAMADQWG